MQFTYWHGAHDDMATSHWMTLDRLKALCPEMEADNMCLKKQLAFLDEIKYEVAGLLAERLDRMYRDKLIKSDTVDLTEKVKKRLNRGLQLFKKKGGSAIEAKYTGQKSEWEQRLLNVKNLQDVSQQDSGSDRSHRDGSQCRFTIAQEV